MDIRNLLLPSVLALFSASSALSADISFVTPSEGIGNLNTPEHFSTGTIPGTEDSLTFAASSPYSVTASDSLSVARLYFKGGPLSLILGSTTLSSTGAAYFQNLDSSTPNNITLESGTLLSGAQSQVLGSFPVCVTVTGPNAIFQTAGMSFGSTGNGHVFNILNGAKLRSSGSIGVGDFGNDCVMNISGEGSMLALGTGDDFTGDMAQGRLVVGGKGLRNILNITDGATVISPAGNWCYLGLGGNAISLHNRINIMGENTLLLAGEFRGANGNGSSNTVYIADGGCLSVTNQLNFAQNGTPAAGQSQDNEIVVGPGGLLLYTQRANNFNLRGPGNRLVVTGEYANAVVKGVTMQNGSFINILDQGYFCTSNNVSVGSSDTSNHPKPCFFAVTNATAYVYNSNIGLSGNGSFISIGKDGLFTGDLLMNNKLTPRVNRLTVNGQNNYMEIVGENAEAYMNQVWIGENGRDNYLSVRNGGFLDFSSIRLGSTATGLRNYMEILDGARVVGTNNSSIVVGNANSGIVGNPNLASNALLRVCNASLSWRGGGNNAIHMRNGSSFQIEGTNTAVSAGSIYITDSSTLTFVPPEDAAVVESTYIKTRTMQFDESSSFTVSELAARRCAENGGGVYTILECTNSDITGYETLLINAPAETIVTVEPRSIKVKIPSSLRTLIMVR